MIAVPFIWFSLIALLQYKKNSGRFDFGLLMASLYAISGGFSVLMEVFNVTDRNYEVSVIGTLVYCSLLTLNLYPFLKYSHLGVYRISPLTVNKPLKVLAWIAFVWFVFTTSQSMERLIEVLTGDMNEIRSMIYREETEAGWMSALPGPVRLVVALLNMCFGMPWILIMLAFFSLYVQNLPVKYFIFFMAASLSGPISGIAGADRSATAYWILSLLMNYLFFFPLVPRKHKKYLNTFLIIIVIALASYLTAMTVSRFEERSNFSVSGISNTEGSLISYLGQSFPNFCYFFDKFDPAFSNLNLLFPFTAKYILGEETVGGVPLQNLMSLKTGVETGVFYTYLGQIRIFCGMSFMFLFSFLYWLFSQSQLSKIMRQSVFSLQSTFVYFAFASIFLLGLFAYPYSSPTKTAPIIFMYLFFKHKRKSKQNKQHD